jgi:hypothetical protein
LRRKSCGAPPHVHHAGERFIRTDTDVSSFPMANAFRRAGYQQFATRREYSVKL